MHIFLRLKHVSGLGLTSGNQTLVYNVRHGVRQPTESCNALPQPACMCWSVAQSCPTLCDPMDYGPPGASVPGILSGRILVDCHFLLQEIFLDQGIEPESPALAGRFFTTEPQGIPCFSLGAEKVK